MFSMDKPLWVWASFISIILILLVLDLGVFNKRDHKISIKESLWMSAFYIFIALIFSIWILYYLGKTSFEMYLTGYLVEKTLSLDNIFVISLVFKHFSIPAKYQHRVLFWGILGVIVLRAVMIGAGISIVTAFHWVLYIMGAFLIFTGIKMLLMEEKEFDIESNPALIWMRKHLPITDKLHDNHFYVYLKSGKANKLFFTPLFVALVVIEFVDVVFAIDSIPAIFLITDDPYIIYTSNVFAILGLRALYFALAAIIDKFHYLKYSLALVLMFIGSKIFIADILGIEKIDSTISLSVTFGLIFGGVVTSLMFPAKTKDKTKKH